MAGPALRAVAAVAVVLPIQVPTSTTASLPPTVHLTSPAMFTEYTAPATIEVTATASDPDGTVAAVELYDGATLLDIDTEAPYAWTLDGVGGPEFTVVDLRARAYDDTGASTLSSRLMVFVNPALPPNDEIVLRGTVLRDPYTRCLYMNGPDGYSYLVGGRLFDQPGDVIREGAELEIRGIPHREWWSTCQFGIPLEVLSVQPAG
jgi:hypothetical protein